jgi:16S rRNA (guanine966-N2)-methyltransferase
MRVIGGVARGRALKAPASSSVRPTSGRAREAIFDALGAIGAVEGASVLDLFCGSGALGIEALSRGASSATFVDHDRAALEVVDLNLRSTGLGGPEGAVRTRLIRRDALTFLGGSGPFDLAFVDPPYAFDAWPTVLSRLEADIAVLESNMAIEPEGPYALYRSYRYGGTLVHIVKRQLNAEERRS